MPGKDPSATRKEEHVAGKSHLGQRTLSRPDRRLSAEYAPRTLRALTTPSTCMKSSLLTFINPFDETIVN